MKELQQYNQWILWKNENGNKVPYSIKGHRASVINKAHWCSYEQVWKAYYNATDGEFSGVGFVLTEEDPFVFVDLDIKSAEDECLSPLFSKICDFAGSYSEFSPSQKGIHLILKSDLQFSAMKTRVIEIYRSGRYMTMTLNETSSSTGSINRNDLLLNTLLSIRDCTMENVRSLISKFSIGIDDAQLYTAFSIKQNSNSSKASEKPSVPASACSLQPHEILQKIMSSDKMARDYMLYSSTQTAVGDRSSSQCDMALANILVYFNEHDREQAIAMFQGTMRGQREKCKREDYIERTFDRAYSGKNSFYNHRDKEDEAFASDHFSYDENGEIFSSNSVEEFEEDIDLLSFHSPSPSVHTPPEAVSSEEETSEEEVSLFDASKREKLQKYIEENQSDLTNGAIPLVRSLNNAFNNPYTVPDNLLGDIASFLYYRSPLPNKTASLMGAISLMGILCGNVYSVYGLGLNIYTLLVAPSTFGKNAIHTGIKSILDQMMCYAVQYYGGDNELFEMIHSLFPKDRVASGPALTNNLSESPSNTYSVNIDEIGEKFADMKKKTSHAHGVLVTMLEQSESSALNGLFTGSDYADKDKNIKPVQRPSINVLATTTPETFYKEIDINQITNGTINRFIMFDCSKDSFPMANTNKKNMLEPELVGKLVELLKYARMEDKGSLDLSSSDIHSKNTVIQFHPSTEENMRLLMINEMMMKNKHLYDNDNVKLALIGRKNAQIMKLAGLLAISENFKMPVIHNSHLKWAKNIVDYTSSVIEKKYDAGEIGGNQMESDQMQVLRKRLYTEFYEGSASKKKNNKHITPLMYNHKVASYRFIQQTVGKSIEFRSDRYLKPADVLDKVIGVCIRSGFMTKLDKDFTITVEGTVYNNKTFRTLVGISQRPDMYLIHPSIQTSWIKKKK